MHHVPDSLLRPRWPLAYALLLLAGCPDGSEGDDLPPGAFTTGGDEFVDPSDTETTTSVGPDDTTTTTTSPPDTSSSDDVTPGEVSFDADIQPMFNGYCLAAPCHDSEAPSAGLDLQSAGARDRLCSTNSTTQTSIALVDCEGFDPDASWLWSKVTGDGLEAPGAGSLMPSGGMLTSDELDTIEAWITGGALP